MWEKIKKHIGQYYIFRLDGALVSGFFCGIGEVDGDHGMMFIDVECSGRALSSCLLIHPLQIKCTLYSDMLSLRRACRKTFRKFKLANHSKNIYYPSFEVNGVEG